MDKKFKEVRNVLNMKNIIGAGIIMGTLFISTSAFAAEQDQETTRYSIQDRVNNGSFNFQNQFDNDYASLLQSKKAAQKQRVLLWTEQKSNSTGNSIAQTQDADSHVTLDQVSVNEGNTQDQATDVVEEQDQLADGNEMIQDQLSANENAQGQNVLLVQAITKYKISIMKLHQIKAGFGSYLSQIQDSYKYNSQNQGNGGNGNTQDQFAYNDSDANQNAEGDLIDQLQGSYDTNIQNQQTAGEGNYPYQDIYNGTTQDQAANGNGITQDQLADNLSEQISGVNGNNNDADQYSYNFNNQDQVGEIGNVHQDQTFN